MSDRLPILSVHEAIDREARVVETKHHDRLECKQGCADCCVDDLTVFEIEADRIRAAYPELLASGEAHPVGRCAFLDRERSCRVYEARPYVCRTQGLPLRWVEDDDDGQWREMRDICPLNEAGPALETLDEADCWTLGPFESRLAELQKRTKGALERVSLRSLFVSGTRA